MIKLTSGQEWFERQKHVWDRVIKPLFVQREYCRAIEVGSWEGGSACWILDNLCAGRSDKNKLICIDHFDLMRTANGRARRAMFQANINATGMPERVRIMPEFSTLALFKLMSEFAAGDDAGYDLIYIDGSHRADDTLLDAEMAWRMASERCVFVFDDYEWDGAEAATIKHPKSGIDAFLSVHAGEYDLLHKGYQIIIIKRAGARLGFLPSYNSIL